MRRCNEAMRLGFLEDSSEPIIYWLFFLFDDFNNSMIPTHRRPSLLLRYCIVRPRVTGVAAAWAPADYTILILIIIIIIIISMRQKATAGFVGSMHGMWRGVHI